MLSNCCFNIKLYALYPIDLFNITLLLHFHTRIMAKKSTKEGRKSKSSSEKSSNNKSSNATKGKESGSKREKTAKGKCTASRKAKNKSTFSGNNREQVPSTEPSTQFEVTKAGSAMQLERRDSQTEAKFATTAPNMAPKRYYSVIFQNPYLFPDAPESKVSSFTTKAITKNSLPNILFY